MYILSDYSLSTFARRLGSKDKKKRERPSIRRGMLTGAKWGAGLGVGLTGLTIASALARKDGRQAMRAALKAQGRNPSLRKNAGMLAGGAGLIAGANALTGGIQGGLIGGGVNAIRKYQYDRDNARYFMQYKLVTFGRGKDKKPRNKRRELLTVGGSTLVGSGLGYGAYKYGYKPKINKRIKTLNDFVDEQRNVLKNLDRVELEGGGSNYKLRDSIAKNIDDTKDLIKGVKGSKLSGKIGLTLSGGLLGATLAARYYNNKNKTK
jgi:hypothetical protein